VTGPQRGVSTVADVTLAVLLIAAAMALLVGFVNSGGTDHEPLETEYTTETLFSSTMNTTYHVERAVVESRAAPDIEAVYEETDYEKDDLRRESHGPVVAQLGDVAVANVEFDHDVFSSGRLTRGAHEFRQRLDEKLQSRLVESSFETHVTAVWTPFEGEDWVRGAAQVGQTPPRYEDVSSTTVTVSSDIPGAREEALAAVEAADDFDVVAEIVATAVVEGYFPELESQRALESPGVERDLVVARYQNMAAILEPEPDALRPGESFEQHLGRNTANASRANEILVTALTARFERLLEPEPAKPPSAQPLGNATAAAKRIATGDVTVTIRTWE
jgi:hypothetical protein